MTNRNRIISFRFFEASLALSNFRKLIFAGAVFLMPKSMKSILSSSIKTNSNRHLAMNGPISEEEYKQILYFAKTVHNTENSYGTCD